MPTFYLRLQTGRPTSRSPARQIGRERVLEPDQDVNEDGENDRDEK